MKTLLIILGFPLWFPLLLAFYVVLFSLYIVLWSVFAAFAVSSVATLIYGIYIIFVGNIDSVLITFGASLVLCGLSILLYSFAKSITSNSIDFIKKILPFGR